jgi:hypothetical protein
MNKELSDAMLVAQLRKKQQLKQQCLHQEEESPLHAESEKLLALSKLVDESPEGLAFASFLQKEQKFLDSILNEMQTSYDGMPAAMRASATGQYAKNSMLLTRGALHRLQEAEKAEPKEMTVFLEEAAFLLDGADGRA